MTSFNQLGLSSTMLASVERMGFSQATPVQERAIPLVLEGRDIVAAAQTGTGKTAAFILPSMDSLPHAQGGDGPLMLVVTPTRELAQQISEVADQVAVSTHHRVTTVVGGLSYRPQIDRLRRGTDLLIATPGRLIDLMDQHAVRLADVKVLVLDEADRMLDMGFLPSVKKIVAATPATRQTLLFSATIDKSILGVVGSMLRDPATVEIARKGEIAATIDQFLIRAPQSVKPALIKAVLAEKGADRVIVFTRTRSRADSTCRRLRKAGYSVEAIHSNRNQNQRRRALEKFAKGEVNIITATDVLARGIDVDEVDYVINYDVPEQAEDYVHRIGRTGRAGKGGFSVTFVTPDNTAELKAIQKLIKRDIPEMGLQNFDIAEAQAVAAEASIAAQSKRDPEVNVVKRQLANKAAAREQLEEERKIQREERAGKSPARRRKRKQKATTPTANAKNSRSSSAKPTKPVKPAKATKGRKGPEQASGRPARPSKSRGDFRPGRAHRAEVERARSKKRS